MIYPEEYHKIKPGMILIQASTGMRYEVIKGLDGRHKAQRVRLLGPRGGSWLLPEKQLINWCFEERYPIEKDS